MIAIIGLGNIGAKYSGSRHNVGFAVVDELRNRYDFPEWTETEKYYISEHRIAGVDIALVKPTTYMNLSGDAVLAISTRLRIKPTDIAVIHDDLDIDVGALKVKRGGGNAGHNGLRSIDSRIGVDYKRIRIGISHPKKSECPQMDVSDYVIAKIPPAEFAKIGEAINVVATDFNRIFLGTDEESLTPKKRR